MPSPNIAPLDSLMLILVGSLTVKEVKPSQDADALSIGEPLLPSIPVIKKFGSATIGAPVAALNTSQRMVAEKVEVLDLYWVVTTSEQPYSVTRSQTGDGCLQTNRHTIDRSR